LDRTEKIPNIAQTTARSGSERNSIPSYVYIYIYIYIHINKMEHIIKAEEKEKLYNKFREKRIFLNNL